MTNFDKLIKTQRDFIIEELIIIHGIDKDTGELKKCYDLGSREEGKERCKKCIFKGRRGVECILAMEEYLNEEAFL